MVVVSEIMLNSNMLIRFNYRLIASHFRKEHSLDVAVEGFPGILKEIIKIFNNDELWYIYVCKMGGEAHPPSTRTVGL